MAVSDPVADMLTKVRNANMAKHEKVDVSTSKMKLQIVKILKNEGYIKNFKKVTKDGISYIRVFLKYDDNQSPVLHGIQRISTPGRRVYTGYRGMPRVLQWAWRRCSIYFFGCHHREEGYREQGRWRADLLYLVRW